MNWGDRKASGPTSIERRTAGLTACVLPHNDVLEIKTSRRVYRFAVEVTTADRFETPQTNGYSYLVVGAIARHLLLVNVLGISAARMTRDIDLAFAIENWDQFHTFHTLTELMSLIPTLTPAEQDAVAAFIKYLKETPKQPVSVREALDEFVHDHEHLLQVLAQTKTAESLMRRYKNALHELAK